MTNDRDRAWTEPNPESRERQSWVSETTVRLAQAGDPVAIERLLDASHPHVRRFARTLCRSREDAEDAAQEAMVVLFRRIGTLRAPGALAAWMYRIVVNECLRLSRHMLTGDADVDPTPALGEDPLVRQLQVERLVTAIASLSPEQREVFIMRDLRGYSGAESAAMLGISASAMKTRLHRARAQIRRFY